MFIVAKGILCAVSRRSCCAAPPHHFDKSSREQNLSAALTIPALLESGSGKAKQGSPDVKKVCLISTLLHMSVFLNVYTEVRTMAHTSTLTRNAGMAGRPLPPHPYDFLLPTGVIVQVGCSSTDTLSDIKKNLFSEAKRYPLFSLLRDQAWYNLQGVTNDGAKEEFVDDTRILKELDLFGHLFKLVERQGDQTEKFFNAEIGNLIGRRLHDFDVMGPEIQDFRRSILPICEDAFTERKKSARAMAKYYYPPSLDETSALPANTPQHIVNSQQLQIEVMFADAKQSVSKQLSATVPVSVNIEPSGIIKHLFQKKFVVSASHSNNDDYVLKICGREEYLLEECPIAKYKVILFSKPILIIWCILIL